MTPTDDDITFYRDNGYLVVKDVMAPSRVQEIMAEGTEVCRGSRGFVDGLQPSKVFDSDEAVLARYITCSNVHKASPLLAQVVKDDSFADVVEKLIGPNVKSLVSQFWIKHSGMPGNAWHQDELFVPTRDRSLCTAWLALDPATIENGCLRVVPGSHKPGVLYPMRPHNSVELDRAEEAYGFPDEDKAVTIELASGSCVFFSGYLLHSSLKNQSSGFRRALLYQYVSAETPMAYGHGNIPVSNYYDNRDFILVRGIDPYAWKAREEVLVATLRAAGATKEDLILSELREKEKAAT